MLSVSSNIFIFFLFSFSFSCIFVLRPIVQYWIEMVTVNKLAFSQSQEESFQYFTFTYDVYSKFFVNIL